MSLKVFFYHANDLLAGTNTLFLSVVVPYLKTYIDYNIPEIADSIEWVLPSQYKKTDEELIQFCNEKNIDVLCTSHYIWNNTFLMDQITRVKPYLNPNILIVSGGPALDVNVNPNFFDQYPFIDYAIYGPGEIAFADLAKSLITDKKLIAFNTSNIAWKDKSTNKINIANFKYVPELKQSPYLHCEKILEETMKSTDGHLALMPYELTRGCPYSCTFCDWNSGFGNKTTRRKNSFKEEIDMFQKLGITSLYLSDANVGQYDEDVELVAYLAEKNIKENANFKVNGNFSKLKLENNLKIVISGGAGSVSFPAYISAISDAFTVNWNDLSYVGRQETLKTFKGVSRGGNLGFKVVSFSAAEGAANKAKLNKLINITSVGTGGGGAYVVGPLVTLTIGKWFVNKTVAVSSCKIDAELADATWDLDIGMPQIVTVSLDFTVLEQLPKETYIG